MRNNAVGQRVRQARQRAGSRITQEELATQLQLAGWDIGRSGVAKIELGMRRVTDLEVISLAKALGVSAAWLLGETDIIDPPTTRAEMRNEDRGAVLTP